MTCCCSCLLTVIAGVIYPLFSTYQSYKLQEKQKLWTAFWIIVTSIFIVEQLTFGLLEYIPFYHLLKTLYVIWLYHSEFQGALLILELAQPLLEKLNQMTTPLRSALQMVEGKQRTD